MCLSPLLELFNKNRYSLLHANFTSIHLTEKRKSHPQRKIVMQVCLRDEILKAFLSVVAIFPPQSLDISLVFLKFDYLVYELQE